MLRDRIDLAAQAVERVAVDAGQQSAVAEFVDIDRGRAELPTQDETAGLEHRQAAFNVLDLQATALRQLLRREWPGLGERAIQAQTIAQVDHQRDHLALLVAPHVERVGLQLLGIGGGFWSTHRDLLLASVRSDDTRVGCPL